MDGVDEYEEYYDDDEYGDGLQDIDDYDERFYTYSVDAFDHPIAFYPEEMNAILSSLNYGTLDFAEWDPTAKQPYLSTWKWMESRHQSNFYNSTAGADGPALQTVVFNVW